MIKVQILHFVKSEECKSCTFKEMIQTFNFKQLSENITVKEYLEHIGIEICNGEKILCPFHGDRNPSMKVDSRFHCFACGADGDVIDFVSRYFEISKTEAAERIASEFGIVPEKDFAVITGTKCKPNLREQKNVYMQYLISLEKEMDRWLEKYKPKPGDEELHFLFVTALNKKEYIGYLIDALTECVTQDDISEFFKTNGGVIT